MGFFLAIAKAPRFPLLVLQNHKWKFCKSYPLQSLWHHQPRFVAIPIFIIFITVYGLQRRKNKANQNFWIPKIERNMQRDKEVNQQLENMDYTIFRFWTQEIKTDLNRCINDILVYIDIHDNQLLNSEKLISFLYYAPKSFLLLNVWLLHIYQ